MSNLQLTVVPRSIAGIVASFCQSVVPGSAPVYVQCLPDGRCQANECFNNVQLMMSLYGGSMLCGWTIWLIPQIMIEAEFHAVWKFPSGELVDTTPHVHGEERILFLPDASASPPLKQRNNVRQAILDHPLVHEFIDRANRVFEVLDNYPDGSLVSLPESISTEYRPFRERFDRLAIANRSKRDPCVCGSGRQFRKCCMNRRHA